MPAANVSIQAIFEEFTYPNRIDDDAASTIAVFDNEHVTQQKSGEQTLKDDSKSYSELAEGQYNIALTSDLKQANNQIYTSFDIKLDDGDKLYIRPQDRGGDTGVSYGGKITFTAAEGNVSIANDDGSSTTSFASTMTSGNWYKVVLSSTYNANGSSSNFNFKVYPITLGASSEVLGTEAASGTTSARNIANGKDKTYNYVRIAVEAGTPAIDNCYVYTDAKYTATVTVKDGDKQAIEGATVKLNDINSSSTTTNENGIAEFTLLPGTYNITIDKHLYSAPEETQTLIVAKIDENNTTNNTNLTMTAKNTSSVTFAATDSTGDTTVDNFDVEVKRGDDILAATSGKTYTLEQGSTYTYKITPTGADAAAYNATDAVSFTVQEQNSETVTAKLSVKTYSITFKNAPRFASITVGSNEPVYTDESGKVDGADYVATGITGGSTVSYTVAKTGYTTLSDTTGAITDDSTEIDCSSVVPTSPILFSEDFNSVGLDNDATMFFTTRTGDIALKYQSATKDAKITGSASGPRADLASISGVEGYNTYTLTYKMSVPATGSNPNRDETNTTYFGVVDDQGKLLFALGAGYNGKGGALVNINSYQIGLSPDVKNYNKPCATDWGKTTETILDASTVTIPSDIYVKAVISPAAKTVALTLASDADFTTIIGEVNNKALTVDSTVTYGTKISKLLVSCAKSCSISIDDIKIVGSDPIE